jgi:16S rRNA (guanine1207-N2)-methyltransferase
MSAFSLDDLRRWPDFEAPELRAWDAADTLILDEAGDLLPGAEVTVVGDDYGALTLGALDRGAANVRVHQDRLSAELALAANGDGDYRSLPLEAALLNGATLVLLRLPRSLDALDEIAALIAGHASPGVVVIAGGRIKHMTVTMNEVLARHFGQVDVTHARQKSRCLVARQPLAGPFVEPRRQFHADLGLWVVATGGVFAGTSVDIGTRALLRVLDRVGAFQSAVDLGCGTGLLAASLARQAAAGRTGAWVLATDESAAAVASTTLTMQANDLDVMVTRDDAGSRIPDHSVDVVVLNPPFHTGAAVHSGVSTKLFEAASRMLRPGGELWTVFNSHLDYRPTLERIVGPTSQVERTPKFTVTLSRRR